MLNLTKGVKDFETNVIIEDENGEEHKETIFVN